MTKCSEFAVYLVDITEVVLSEGYKGSKDKSSLCFSSILERVYTYNVQYVLGSTMIVCMYQIPTFLLPKEKKWSNLLYLVSKQASHRIVHIWS